MAGWRPDWKRMLAEAPEVDLEGRPGHLYFIADAHLGDARAAPEDFLATLGRLADPAAVVFMGDLFKVWLALPRLRNAATRAVLAGFAALRARGVPLVFVVGNREYLLPADAGAAQALGLPFDHIVHEMAFLRWGGRRIGIAHGDIVNREDRQYLRWRRLSRSRPMTALFRAMPGPLARRLAQALEASLARTNREIKISYPAGEVRAFAEAVTPHCHTFLIGHFHLDETVRAPGGGTLRILPDWFSRRAVMRLTAEGDLEQVEGEGGDS